MKQPCIGIVLNVSIINSTDNRPVAKRVFDNFTVLHIGDCKMQIFRICTYDMLGILLRYILEFADTTVVVFMYRSKT